VIFSTFSGFLPPQHIVANHIRRGLLGGHHKLKKRPRKAAGSADRVDAYGMGRIQRSEIAVEPIDGNGVKAITGPIAEKPERALASQEVGEIIAVLNGLRPKIDAVEAESARQGSRTVDRVQGIAVHGHARCSGLGNDLMNDRSMIGARAMLHHGDDRRPTMMSSRLLQNGLNRNGNIRHDRLSFPSEEKCTASARLS
jgi:hypothetical protein